MKKSFILFLLIFLLASFSLHPGLFVDSRNIMRDKSIRYIEMTWEKEKGKVTNINIKYGEREDHLDKTGLLTGRSGRKLEFRTIQEAVNHIKKNGWSDLKSFIRCFSGNAIYHFFFKKIN